MAKFMGEHAADEGEPSDEDLIRKWFNYLAEILAEEGPNLPPEDKGQEKKP